MSDSWNSISVATFASPSRLGYPPARSQREKLLGRLDALLALTEQARAAYDANVAAYRQTVLASFQQVEDEIVTLHVLEQQSVVEEAAVAAAREAEKLTLNQYKAGTVPYSSVITAQTTRLNSEETALSVFSNRLQASVTLIEALGGGWKEADLPP